MDKSEFACSRDELEIICGKSAAQLLLCYVINLGLCAFNVTPPGKSRDVCHATSFEFFYGYFRCLAIRRFGVIFIRMFGFFWFCGAIK